MAPDAVTDRPAGYQPTQVQLEAWFPEVDPGLYPFGTRILVQLKKPRHVTRGGIELPQDLIETEQDNAQVAIVRAIGSLSYRKRDTMAEWPEGLWCKPGDIVRVPRFGQHERFKFPDATGHEVEFRLYDDFQILGLITGEPDRFRAYL